ncbi:carboxypeptidase-like regulatory domain-containing protein [Hyunsoonleella flava]|uniref:Carboxypeptidase-like regulatory domain-containing protein n=1 Tax=Hyunsoonleella flava TaxID=2527939 RepID=A0A4Q9FH62_9FLAO|nr:carboxypeptidase-like regulatory domain-containing protein [Hyunsoonleella flava]TBN04693.1 carboxypeptidase-like regulatory domain-containing protein [Hyunsoonleella flava]
MFSIVRKTSLFFLLVLILFTNVINSQENGLFNCRLINAKDKTPLPYATILIKNKAKGLISNIDGGFKIPYELQTLNDTLVISSIGFATKEVSLSNFDKNIINIITLAEKTEILSEVVVVASKKRRERKSALEIFNLALDKIPENYQFTPYSYIGYYRDYQIKEGDYLNLNEAIMEVFDPGFAAIDFNETQTRIYQYKKNTTFPTDLIASRPYDFKKGEKTISSSFNIRNQNGNEFTILRAHDAIRNYSIDTYDFVNRFDFNFVKNHQIKRLPDTSINNIALYCIDIYKAIEHVVVKGKIYISKGDFKIYKMQYAVYDSRKSNKSKKKQDTEEQNFGKLQYEIILEYQLKEDKMYLSYISFNNTFEVLQNPKFTTISTEVNYTKRFDPISNTYEIIFNSFEITFNNILSQKNALKKSNYKLRYRDKKLKIDSIKVNKDKVVLYLNKKLLLSSREMKSSNKNIENDIIIEIKKIKDINGNIVNHREYANYNQYREFFVQELKLNSSKPVDPFFMLKNKPIFKNQPIAPFDNLSDYWLNTPLKSN